MFSTDQTKRGYETPESRAYSILMEDRFCSAQAEEVEVNPFVEIDEDLD